MISHECSSIKYEYFLLNYFVSSLYLLLDSTLPNGEVRVTIWLFCKIDFSWLSSPLCQVIESTMFNCQIHVAKLAFPSYQFHTTRATLPNCQVQICFVNYPWHKTFLGCQMFQFFSSLLKLLHKQIKPFQNSNYPLN